MSGPFGSQQWMYASGGFYPYELDNSLKFEDGDNSYLSRTPTSAGNRKTWTWSAWVKRGNISSNQNLFSVRQSSTQRTIIRLSSDKIDFLDDDINFRLTTNAVLRDTSSWYHIVVVVDTSQSTSSDRLKIYVNGEQITSFSTSTYPSQNYEGQINNTVLHALGREGASSNDYFDGYLAEVNFIDGTALDASSFGEFKEGIWIPKDPTDLTYGTNGFRLPFTETTTAEGFNTVTYTGNGATQSIEGVGFEPDLIWAKNRSDTNSHWWVDSVRGVNKRLISNSTAAEDTPSNLHSSFDSDGFTVGSNTEGNKNANNYVAWCWDAGTGSAASNTDGSITSTVKANQDYGFSIVSYTGTGSNATVGHGLGVAPDMIIIKSRTTASDWGVYHSANTSAPETEYLELNLTNATADNNVLWNDTAPTSSVFTIGTANMINKLSDNFVAYCFADVTGYQKIGTYSGNGSSSGPTITTGFKPAFVIIKRTDSTGNWNMFDSNRDVDGHLNDFLYPNTNNAEGIGSLGGVTPSDTGFQVTSTYSDLNNSSGTYIYLAIADTRDAAFWTDASGNGNDWEPVNLQHSDVMPDTPTDGFATLNPTFKTYNANPTFSEGNLTVAPNVANYQNAISTIGVSSGKWYAEIYCNGTPNSANYFGVGNDTEINALASTSTLVGHTTGGYSIQMYADDKRTNNSNTTGYSSAFASGDIMNIAMDLDNGKVWFGKNGTYFSSGDPAAGTNEAFSGLSGTFYVILTMYNAGFTSAIANFGQDSSFNANEIAQGNADENGKGDFYYAPPSGFLALCNANLPDPAIDPNKGDNPENYFNTVLYTGNGASSQAITGVGFQPDFTWIKSRSLNQSGPVFSSLQDGGMMRTPLTSAEGGTGGTVYFTSFDSDGFTLGTVSDAMYNQSSATYVAWNWLAGGTGVSNTDGSITSTVSANTEAGFSIVSYTGTGANATVGHGLDAAPDMMIVRNRDVTANFIVYHSANTSAPETDYIMLNSTAATADASSIWNDTAPTSSVFSVGISSNTNGSSNKMIAYCFANKEGYSKFGSYTGNGSSDGPFVYTGFRPAFVIIKRTDATAGWQLIDSTRSPYNEADDYLYPNASDAEYGGSGNDGRDYLSNGFKLSNTYSGSNASGGTYIYMAFAEQPFKYSNAR